MSKVYLSGAITGVSNFEEIFENYERYYNANFGYIVINPARHPKGLNRESYMLLSFVEISEVDVVIMLPNWKQSQGAKIEKLYAEYLGKEIRYAL